MHFWVSAFELKRHTHWQLLDAEENDSDNNTMRRTMSEASQRENGICKVLARKRASMQASEIRELR